MPKREPIRDGHHWRAASHNLSTSRRGCAAGEAMDVYCEDAWWQGWVKIIRKQEIVICFDTGAPEVTSVLNSELIEGRSEKVCGRLPSQVIFACAVTITVTHPCPVPMGCLYIRRLVITGCSQTLLHTACEVCRCIPRTPRASWICCLGDTRRDSDTGRDRHASHVAGGPEIGITRRAHGRRCLRPFGRACVMSESGLQ